MSRKPAVSPRKKPQLSMSELLLGVSEPKAPRRHTRSKSTIVRATSTASQVKGVAERKFFLDSPDNPHLAHPLQSTSAPVSPVKPTVLSHTTTRTRRASTATNDRPRSLTLLSSSSSPINVLLTALAPGATPSASAKTKHRRSASWLSNILSRRKSSKEKDEQLNNVKAVQQRVRKYAQELTKSMESYRGNLSKLANKNQEVMSSLTGLMDKTQRYMQLEKLGFLQICKSLRMDIFDSQFKMYRLVLVCLKEQIALCKQLLDEIGELSTQGHVLIQMPEHFFVPPKLLVAKLKDVPALLTKRKSDEADLMSAQEQYSVVSKKIDAEEKKADRKQELKTVCAEFYAYINSDTARPYMAARGLEFRMLKWLCDERHTEGKILARWFAKAEAANLDTLGDSHAQGGQFLSAPGSRSASRKQSIASTMSDSSPLSSRSSTLSTDTTFTNKMLVDHADAVAAEHQEAFGLLIERVLFPRTWKLIRELDHVDDTNEQLVYDERVLPLRSVSPDALGVQECFLPGGYSLSPTDSAADHPYSACVSVLEDMMQILVPSDLLLALIACIKLIYTRANLLAKAHYGRDKKKKHDLGADSFFPIFLFALIHARMPDIVGRLKIVEYYAAQSMKHGEEGYYLATLQSAVSYVTNETHIDVQDEPAPAPEESKSALLRMGLVDSDDFSEGADAMDEEGEERDVARELGRVRVGSVRSMESHVALFEAQPESFNSTAMSPAAEETCVLAGSGSSATRESKHETDAPTPQETPQTTPPASCEDLTLSLIVEPAKEPHALHINNLSLSASPDTDASFSSNSSSSSSDQQGPVDDFLNNLQF